MSDPFFPAPRSNIKEEENCEGKVLSYKLLFNHFFSNNIKFIGAGQSV